MRQDFYYLLQGDDGESEEGHILCSDVEAKTIESILKAALPEYVSVTVEYGGEYDFIVDDYTVTAEAVAQDILNSSGFIVEDEDDEG